jgi:hypothetical protein
MAFLYGVIALLLGLAFVFSGLPLFRFLIPVWGFFGGFSLGMSVSTSLFGSNFLGGGIGLVVGLVLAILFAALSYFFFNIAVIILAATVGYWLGAGLMVLIGFNSGVLTVTVGIAVAVVAAIIALVGNFAKYFIVVVTAFGGATTAIAGILMMLHKIEPSALSLSISRVAINQSTLWTIVWVVLAVVGMGAQLRNAREYEMVMWGNDQLIQPVKD